TQYYQGPSQHITVHAGHTYSVSGWIKLLNDGSGHNNVQLEVDFQFTDGTHDYQTGAGHGSAKASNGWIHLTGDFTVPSKALRSTRIYYQSGPDASVNFIVDDTSVTDEGTATQVSSSSLDQTINRERKSDINFNVTTSGSINKADVRIHVVQKKKSFPFGTAVNARKYNANAANGKYRDFIHKHFTWAVPENALKWPSIEPHRGQKNYQPALDMIHGLKNHGLKVRGHNLVWSVPRHVQDWVKAESGNQLRATVKNHIEETMNAYLAQAQHFKSANVGLYGIGVQCHFGNEVQPQASAIHISTLREDLDSRACPEPSYAVYDGPMFSDFVPVSQQDVTVDLSDGLQTQSVQCCLGIEAISVQKRQLTYSNAMKDLVVTWMLAMMVTWCAGQNLLQNGGFESGNHDHWDCWGIQCVSTTDKHSGQHAVKVTGRQHFFDGPSQYVNIKSGHTYTVSGWVKLLNNGGGSQYVQMEVDFHFSDDSHDYVTAAERPNVKTSNGWVHLTGGFTAPSRSLRDTRIYFQSGPDASVNFVVDEASVTEVSGGSSHSSSGSLDQIIDRERKSDIHIQ
ncbi:hypothetical protein BaRGS_00001691, partial [Batillaria attramentaria]